MKIPGSNQSGKLIHNSICIILLSNVCILSIWEETISNSSVQSLGPFLVMLSISDNVNFGDTREVSLIDP